MPPVDTRLPVTVLSGFLGADDAGPDRHDAARKILRARRPNAA